MLTLMGVGVYLGDAKEQMDTNTRLGMAEGTALYPLLALSCWWSFFIPSSFLTIQSTNLSFLCIMNEWLLIQCVHVGANPVVSLLGGSWAIVDGCLLLVTKWESGGRRCGGR